jgi:hypothetical protein
MQALQEADHEPGDDEQGEDPDDRREVQRSEGRKEAAKDPQVGLADVVEEALDSVHPDRVRQPHPGREDVREDQKEVDEREDLDEILNRRHPVGEQDRGSESAHTAIFGFFDRSPPP